MGRPVAQPSATRQLTNERAGRMHTMLAEVGPPSKTAPCPVEGGCCAEGLFRATSGRLMFERLVPALALAIILLLGLGGCRDAAFKAASKRDTITDWKAFIAQNPSDENVEAAQARLAELEFEEAKKAHTLIAYKRFLERHPESGQARAAAALFL